MHELDKIIIRCMRKGRISKYGREVRKVQYRNAGWKAGNGFITNFIYFIILGGIFLFVMKRFVPMFFPFILGLAVAAVLSPLIGKLCEKTGGKRALVSIVVLLVFYGLLVLAALFSASHVVTFIQNLAGKLPQFYVEVIEPELGILFERIVVSFPEYQDWVSQMSASLENALQSGIMTVSGTLIGWGASWIVGFPAILVQTIFTIISSFFLHNRL